MLGLARADAQTDLIPEPIMQRLGLLGLPRGRLVSVSGPDPERRQSRLWRWALHFCEQRVNVLWLDPLAMCLDRPNAPSSPFPLLSPRSVEAVDHLLCLTLPDGHTNVIILDNFCALQTEDQIHPSTVESSPMKWCQNSRYLARWTGLCWRYQCTLVIGRRGLVKIRDPVDNHAILRFQLSPTRGSLQLLESRALVPGLGWRRLPGD